MTLPDVDLGGLDRYNDGVLRSRAEYALLPSTTGRYIEAPCIRACGRTSKTHRGLCPECVRTERSQGDR